MGKRKLLVFALLLTGFIGGCTYKPEIPGYHWHGSTLYARDGVKVASVADMEFFSEDSQACIFIASGVAEIGCTYWETGQQAYDHIEQAFKAKRP